jgi:hypothetical protein
VSPALGVREWSDEKVGIAFELPQTLELADVSLFDFPCNRTDRAKTILGIPILAGLPT